MLEYLKTKNRTTLLVKAPKIGHVKIRKVYQKYIKKMLRIYRKISKYTQDVQDIQDEHKTPRPAWPKPGAAHVPVLWIYLGVSGYIAAICFTSFWYLWYIFGHPNVIAAHACKE